MNGCEQHETEAGAAASSSRCDRQGLPECYVIVYNVSKKHNVGTLLRSCTAFGVKEVRARSGRNSTNSAAGDRHLLWFPPFRCT